MKLSEKQQIFTRNLVKLLQYAFEQGYEVTLGEAWRTPEQQKIHFDNGLTKTMNSQHLNRMAIDINIFKMGIFLTQPYAYQKLGKYWKTLHPKNVSGSDWGWDFNHFEMKL